MAVACWSYSQAWYRLSHNCSPGVSPIPLIEPTITTVIVMVMGRVSSSASFINRPQVQ